MKPHFAPARHDVVGIGNAIVDVLARAEDSFIDRHGLTKGAMTLIDEAAAERLYAAMGPGRECSGGSAANTIAALASIGGHYGFVGKVRDDQLGKVFAHDIRALGVAFETLPASRGAPTARCLIFVTPDAQRTMQTFLGASVGLAPEDIDVGMIADSKIVYLEGYLWDPPAAKEAFRKAAKAANDAGRLVALSLSDPFCVDRHRADFRDLVERHVDLLFANEEEIKSLYQVSAFDDALQKVRGHCQVAVLTRSAKGAVVIAGDEVHVIDAEPVAKVVDTTGAGDAFAAGFLYGFTHGFGLARAARAGAIAAAEAIGHFGARPEAPLKALIADRLGAL
ncbi:MAG: adenosine kinase [Rhodospirillales bacterium]|nr:adenosine kinase [Rhodospirillales bacterium]